MKTPFAVPSRVPRPRWARSFIILSLLLLVAAVVAATVAWGAAGASGTASASPRAAATPQPGGTFVVGMQPGEGQFDPVLMDGAAGDVSLVSQVLEPLVKLAPDFSVQPVLATAWKTPDGGKTWDLTLRGGVKFSNAQPFTSADVLYSFDRLRSATLGSPMAATYAGIKSVVADDATHVTFNLKAPDAEFMASLTDVHAKMLCKSVTDPMTELVGTGPFMLKSYAAASAILDKNPLYWGKDGLSNRLPYFDEVDFVYSSNTAGQVTTLKAGTLDWIGGLSSAQKQTVNGDTSLKTATTLTNDCFELQIRCDVGPGKKLAFRQALLAGTDLKALVAAADRGVAAPGNGTLVGPAYAADYRSTKVAYSRARAKRLLAKAGYRSGVTLKLVTQTSGPIPAFAAAWRSQMKRIGVNVSIKRVSPAVYYGAKGTNTWAKAPFGIVDWGTRAVPSTYFKLALVTHATWNYSRWSSAPFDRLCKQIPLTTDAKQRGGLYKQAQRILQSKVPMINLGVLLAVAGESATIDGVVLAPDWTQTLFSTGYFTK